MKYSCILLTLLLSVTSLAGIWPREIHCYKGKTPTIDGDIKTEEWKDAVHFDHFETWLARFNPVKSDKDLDLKWWVKHDGENLFFAFDVSDDVLYGIETERWTPDEFPQAHKLTPEGFPWFGDGVEIMINADHEFSFEHGVQSDGDSTCWQMVCNFTKSRLHKFEKGGLMEGEPRSDLNAWKTYQRWIKNGDMKAAVRKKPDGSGFTVEWMIKAEPCLEIKPGVYWSPEAGITKMGFNLAVQDVDEKKKGKGVPFNLNHENWLAGGQDIEFWPREWATLAVHPGEKPMEIIVSPKGDDENPGTDDKPIATLEKAKEIIKEKSENNDVIIILKEGEYSLGETLVIENEILNGNSLTLASYPAYDWPGEKAVISGGKKISGWKKENENIWSADIAEVKEGKWWFRQLFADGKRLTRAKYPNKGYLTLKKVNKNQTYYEFEEKMPFDNLKGQNAEIMVIQHWSIARGVIEKSDNKSASLPYTLGWYGTPWFCNPAEKMPAHIEHGKELMDIPGEWYLEKDSGKLYYYAGKEENPNDMEFKAPYLDQLLVIKGQKENKIRNVHFRGIDFEYASWKLPDIGYSGLQAAHYGSDYKKDPTYAVPVTVKLEHAENCRFDLCRFKHFGASGLGLSAGCDRNRIVACEFTDIGGNGIMTGWRKKEGRPPRKWFENDWLDPNDAPLENKISNCYVHNTGAIMFGAVGIFDAFTDSTEITNNLVTNQAYTGISVGFRWSTKPSTQKNCLVANNHIFKAMRRITDGGGIYTLGYQPDTILRGNLIHDIERSPLSYGHAENNGIFFDEGSKGFLVENNIIFSTSGSAIRFNQSKKQWHTFNNNFFNVTPSDIGFPWERAALSGLEPVYKNKVLRNFSNCP